MGDAPIDATNGLITNVINPDTGVKVSLTVETNDKKEDISNWDIQIGVPVTNPENDSIIWKTMNVDYSKDGLFRSYLIIQI